MGIPGYIRAEEEWSNANVHRLPNTQQVGGPVTIPYTPHRPIPSEGGTTQMVFTHRFKGRIPPVEARA